MWNERGAPAADAATFPTFRMAYIGGFVVSLANPKTLLFFAAFLPQFAVEGNELIKQLAVLALTFIGVAIVLDSLWAVMAARARRF
jgi:threonine/homoserine/homoserine lactone efflux protein